MENNLIPLNHVLDGVPVGKTGLCVPKKRYESLFSGSPFYMNIYGNGQMPYVYLGGKNQFVYMTALQDPAHIIIKALDFGGFYGCVPLGHSPTQLIAAITRQIEGGCFTSSEYISPKRQSMLAALFNVDGFFAPYFPPGQFHAVGRCTGSEAIDLAIQLAFEQQWDYERRERKKPYRDTIIAFEGAYHGSTFSAKTVMNRKSLVEGTPKVNFETTYAAFGKLNEVASLFQNNKSKVAAVLLEPIQGDKGVVLPPPGFLNGVRELCNQSNALLIADETLTFCRTGEWFASYDRSSFILPDIMIIGKSLGMGIVPVSMVIARKDLAMHPYRGISTFDLPPLSCSVVEEGLRLIKGQGLLEKSAEKGAILLNHIECGKLIKAVRGRGLMVGLELTMEASPHCHTIRCELLELGINTDVMAGSKKEGIGKTLRLSPPLIVEKEDCYQVCEIINRYQKYK